MNSIHRLHARELGKTRDFKFAKQNASQFAMKSASQIGFAMLLFAKAYALQNGGRRNLSPHSFARVFVLMRGYKEVSLGWYTKRGKKHLRLFFENDDFRLEGFTSLKFILTWLNEVQLPIVTHI